MLCEPLIVLIISFADFGSALRLREVNPAFNDAWQIHAKNLEKKEVYPSRTMIHINTCMVCYNMGKDKQILKVPWSIVPPRSVIVCCKNNYCKYLALKSLVERSTIHGSKYQFLTKNIFDSKIQIPRSDGSTTTANPTLNTLVQKKDGSLFVHTSWFEKNGDIFEKCVSLSNPLIQKQLLHPPRFVQTLWGFDHDPL